MNILSKASMTLVSLFAVANLAFAGALDTPDRARAVKSRLSKVILDIEGVNGIGIGGCDARTGKENATSGKDFVYCVAIRTETRDAYKRLSQMYPVGTKVNGVFISVKYIGLITIQPRSTAGN